MTTSLHFSRLVQLIYQMDSLGVAHDSFMRHRAEYEYILSQIQLGTHDGVEVNVNSLLCCPMLGSQPTVTRRINELEDLKLILSEKSDDQRMRIFKLTELGEKYLEECSNTLKSLCQICMGKSQ